MLRRLLTLSLILATFSTLAAAQLHAVPDRFQGEWNAHIEQCSLQDDDSVLKISADHIEFYETGGTPRAVAISGDGLGLTLTAAMSGEGETWRSVMHFRLSADHSQLTEVIDHDKVVRHRCPNNHVS